MFQEVRELLKRREEELQAASNSNNSNSVGQLDNRLHPGLGQANTNAQNQGFFSSALTNIFVIVGFAAFAWTVKYVLRNVVE